MITITRFPGNKIPVQINRAQHIATRLLSVAEVSKYREGIFVLRIKIFDERLWDTTLLEELSHDLAIFIEKMGCSYI
ncbi:MAG: hypothetical protein ACLFR1_05480, partial [Spirochaetia bacterium]